MSREVKKFLDLEGLSEAAAKEVADLILKRVATERGFSLVLSGGNTPRSLYRLLGSTYRDRIPWQYVSVFFGDERYVPHTDKLSNFLMAKETLLNRVPIPPANIHPIPTDLPDPEMAAESYEKELRENLPEKGNSFDLVLLGMGSEGHTASLFPESRALDEKDRWVMSVEVPANPHTRITLTYPILNRAAAIYFLVSGNDKRDALKEIFADNSDFHECPARGIAPASGRVEWWVDSAALKG